MSTNATLLSWINAEVERALVLVRESIAKFVAAPEDQAPLAACPGHLHQVSGALRMVGLSGPTLVCEMIEGSFAGFGGARPSAAAMGVVDRAVLALKDFVGDLARGQADVPMRLYPAYRDLAGLVGKTAVSEKDLFFPDLSIRAPAHIKPKTLAPEKIGAHVQKQRALFQRGLLAWLRQSTRAGLDDMRRAVNQLHKVAAQLPEPQSVWWVAGGLLDALELTQSAEWTQQAKALGSRIEKQMREGTPAVSEQLLRELLYAVATSKGSPPRVKQIRQLYQLEGMFPQAAPPTGVLEFDIERLEVSLYDMHSRLDALKRAWEQYVLGEQKSAGPFRDGVAAFRAKARDLGSQHLLKLLDAISLVSAKLPDPYPRQSQMMVIEMASAFLLVEHVIDNFTAPPADLAEQIGIMGGWLLDASMGRSTGEPPPGLHPDLSERIGALHVRSQVAKEILANLQHVEQVVDAFARDPAKRPTLLPLQPYLRQIRGALTVVGFTRAAEAAAICERLIADCAQPGHARTAEDLDWIAESLSSIGFLLEPCRNGREPAEEAIALFFRRYARRDAPLSLDDTIRMKAVRSAAPAAPVEAPAQAPAAAPQPGAVRPGVDPELLQVFLEEAGEVLQNIGASLKVLRERTEDRDALTIIRRGFHTLKGSGRMVGLMDLGEAAWEVEQVLNRWLEDKRPATPVLLELIEVASGDFSGWVDQLKAGSLGGEADVRRILGLAARARAEAAPAEPAPAAPAPAPDEVVVGAVTLARAFYDIYVKEANAHVAALQAQFARWVKAPAAGAPAELMRAAHTLASSSGTAGFAPISDLAGALEQWTAHAGAPAAVQDTGSIEAAIHVLREMTQAVAQRKSPEPAAGLVQKLHDIIAFIESQPPPPFEAPKAAEPAPPSGRGARVLRDDIDPQLLPLFLEEANELVPHVGSDLRDWKANPLDTKISDSLRRLLHTLKGSARMAGAIRLGELCHLMETRIDEAIEANAFPPDLFDHLEERMDRLSLDVERMRAGGAPEAAPAPAAAPAAVVPAAAAAAAPAPAPRAEAPLATQVAMLRVNADALDQLINGAGEVAIARSRIEAEVRTVKQALADLSESISRLRGQLREFEVQADSQMQSRQSVAEERRRDFDPLEFDRYTRLQELTRLMAESLSDAQSIQQGLLKSIGDADAALVHQARVSRDVQQELMRVRAVPFFTLSERLHRVVRQTLRELGKKAELEIQGGNVEIDRSVLERIGAPLEHMLRNALAHGIESPEARVAAGKPEAGRIVIALRQESNEIALTFSDDGSGLNLEKLREKGKALGALPADREALESELMQLVFVTGLSTAEEITELAGRGVGMDVVKAEINGIGGRVDVTSTRGQGTTFTAYLPLTLAVTQAVLVRCGSHVIALSAAMVEQILRLKTDGLDDLYQKGAALVAGQTYPLFYGPALLGNPAPAQMQPYNSVLLLRSGVQRIALHVDELVGNQEIVVKSIGAQLGRVPGVVGATVLPDGTIAPIMNPVQLAQRLRVGTAEPVAPVAAAPVRSAAAKVMVVDDSLTVRRITGRLLEREGYRVLTAKDGVDALEQLKDQLPAVMLVDIEMPRMDGFDLARALRGDERTRSLPIVFISSRTADKHRSQAAELGVNAFLGKPYQEAELLQLVAQYSAAA